MPLSRGRYESPYSEASQKKRFASPYSTAAHEADPPLHRRQYGGGVVPSGSQDAFRWNVGAMVRAKYSYPQCFAAAPRPSANMVMHAAV
jgi:hypothetical protein